jgi:predicted nucleotidyltransferase
MDVPTRNLDLPMDQIEAFCRRWKIKELEVFGSALRDDFGPESDIDLLATFELDAPWSLFDLVRMRFEIEEIVGRDVDLIERVTIEQSHNPIRRQRILSTAKSIYGAV